MRIGLVSASLAGQVPEEDFQRASAAGAEGLEVFYKGPYAAKELAEEGHAAQLKAWADKYRLDIPCLTLSFLSNAPSLIGEEAIVEQSRRQIRQGLEVAREVGAKVVLVPFFGKNSLQIEEEVNRAAEALSPLVEDAEAAGVVLGLESTLNVSQNQFLLGSLGNSDFVKVYYDVGNMLARKLDPPTGIRELGSDIVQVHFKDVKITPTAPPDYNVPLGGGNVDFGACCQALKAVKYDGWIILETPPGDDPVASAKANLAFLRNVMRE